jgi:hypothetical protein
VRVTRRIDNQPIWIDRDRHTHGRAVLSPVRLGGGRCREPMATSAGTDKHGGEEQPTNHECSSSVEYVSAYLTKIGIRGLDKRCG